MLKIFPLDSYQRLWRFDKNVSNYCRLKPHCLPSSCIPDLQPCNGPKGLYCTTLPYTSHSPSCFPPMHGTYLQQGCVPWVKSIIFVPFWTSCNCAQSTFRRPWMFLQVFICQTALCRQGSVCNRCSSHPQPFLPCWFSDCHPLLQQQCHPSLLKWWSQMSIG